MPNSPSASKRLRQTKVRQARNKAIKSAMRTQVKKVRVAATAGDIETAEAEFKLAAKKLDRCTKHYVRRMSRFWHAVFLCAVPSMAMALCRLSFSRKRR